MPSTSKKNHQLTSHLFWVGLVVLNVGLAVAWWWLYQSTIVSFRVSPKVISQTQYRAELPTKIHLVRQNIAVALEQSQVINGTWQTSPQAASYLIDSARPGEGGNVVIYGHNKKDIFGKLSLVKMNDTVDVEVADGSVHQYRVEDISVVKPTQVQLVLPTKEEVLTIYTCTGWLDSERLVVRAVPTKIVSSLSGSY